MDWVASGITLAGTRLLKYPQRRVLGSVLLVIAPMLWLCWAYQVGSVPLGISQVFFIVVGIDNIRTFWKEGQGDKDGF